MAANAVFPTFFATGCGLGISKSAFENGTVIFLGAESGFEGAGAESGFWGADTLSELGAAGVGSGSEGAGTGSGVVAGAVSDLEGATTGVGCALGLDAGTSVG